MSDSSDDSTDIREAAYLRFRFQDATTVSSVWRYLQKANWTYQGGQYKAPGSETLLDSNSVLKKLDETAIPMLTSYLEFPLEQQPNNKSLSSSSSSQELRRQMIDQLKPELIAKYTEIEVDDKEHASNNDDGDGLRTRKRATRGGGQAINNKKRSNKSIVSADAGADLYTNPPKRPKSSSRYGGETHSMEFPSPQQVAEMFRQNGVTKTMMAEFSKSFLKWKFLLSTNHSLLFYGFGSKRNLLNQFAKDTLETAGDVLAIDGFDQDVTVERILDLMVTIFLNNEEPPPCFSHNNYMEETAKRKIGVYPSIPLISENIDLTRATAISRAISRIQTKRKRPLYLIIHNIDSFRSRPAQDALAALLIHSSSVTDNDIRTIRLVASVDHVNTSTLLWDPETSSNFAFLWQEVHTFEPYIEELKRGRMEKIKGRTGKRTLTLSSSTPASIRDVLYTIAPRHTEVLQALVKLQTATTKKNDAVKFQKLLQDCQNQCIVFSDSQLRQYLTELVDHGLIQKQQEKGTEYLKVPHDASCIQVIMEFKSN